MLTAGTSPRADLQADPFGELQKMSVWAPLVVLGVFAATLSSALGSLLAAPRILQAMGQDRLMKPMEFFGKGSGPTNEPHRATALTFVIAVGILWAGDLNAVAEIISMFFLISYGMINLSAFVESKSANPSFRPRFKYFHWITGMAGAIGCLIAMLKINDTYAIVALSITGMFYFWLRKREIQTNWGDAKRGFIFQRTRDSLLYLETSKFHPKNWRPILAAISPDPLADRRLVQVGAWLESRRGLYTVAEIHETPEPSLAARLQFRKQRREEVKSYLTSLDIVAFSEVVCVDDYLEGLCTFLQSYSVGGLRPNTILVSIPPPHDPDARARFLQVIAMTRSFDLSTVLLKPGELVLDKPRRIIDVWWRGPRNGSLMALLAYLVKQDRSWRTATIRVFRPVPNPEQEGQARAELAKVLENARIEAEIEVFCAQSEPHHFIAERSGGGADLVMLGLGTADLENFGEYLAAMDPLLARLPTTLLVWSNGEADLSA